VWGSSGTREKAEGFVDLEQQREARGFWYWLAFLQPPISVSVSVSSGCIRLLQLCADRFPHSMDQDQIEIITVNNRTSTEIEEPAPAAVGEALNAHQGSEEPDSGSESQNLNYTSDEQEVQAGERKLNPVERRIRTLAQVQGLEPTQINLWKAAFKEFRETATRFENQSYKREEEMRSVKNEIYQVVGFFSAFQGLLITAAAQSNLLRCNNVGFILALSAFATAVAVFGIGQKIKAMEDLRFDTKRIKQYIVVSPYNIFFFLVVASIQHCGATVLKE
jgi:hypothetical protein